jgi:hypothetical protein
MLKIQDNGLFEKWCAYCDYRGTAELYDDKIDDYFCPICEEHDDFFSLDFWQEGESFYSLNCPNNKDDYECDLTGDESHQDWIIREFDKRFVGRTYQFTLPWNGYTIQKGKKVSDFPIGVTTNE